MAVQTDAGGAPPDLDPRDVKALTRCMSVLDDVGRVRDADDLYLVVSESGSEYLVDMATGACECPDSTHRELEAGCQHVRRVAFHTGQRKIPEWCDCDRIDPPLLEAVVDLEVA